MLKGFGKRVRILRRQKDLTQVDIAQSIPMNQSNYSKIERDTQEPNLTQLIAIAKKLNVSTDELLGLKQLKLSETIEDIADGIGQ